MAPTSAEKRAYLPSSWDDDEFMSGLLSMMKERSVNPVDYDRKLKFWRNLIGDSCRGERNALFSLETLKRRFQRNDRVPSALEKVLNVMKIEGEVQSLSEWRSAHSSWVGWSMSVVSSFWKTSPGNGQAELFLHLPTVRVQADEVLAKYREELEKDIDGTSDIISYAELYQQCQDIVINRDNFELEDNFDVILDELTSRGDVSVGESKSGDKIVKFRALRSTTPAAFTESDADFHELRRMVRALEKKMDTLDQTKIKLEQEVRTTLRSGNKKQAMVLLKRKKGIEKDLQDKGVQYDRLCNMIQQIGDSKHNKEVLEAYKVGASAFKQTLARHGLSPEKVDVTMEEIASANDEYREIEEALAQPILGSSSAAADNQDLEDELANLLAAEKKEKATAPAAAMNLPEVPAGSPRRFGIHDEEEDLDRRLLRLREM